MSGRVVASWWSSEQVVLPGNSVLRNHKWVSTMSHNNLCFAFATSTMQILELYVSYPYFQLKDGVYVLAWLAAAFIRFLWSFTAEGSGWEDVGFTRSQGFWRCTQRFIFEWQDVNRGKRYLLTPSFSSIIINMCVSPIVCMLLTEMRKFGDLGVLQELITGCLLRYTHVILLQGLSRAMYGEDNV